MKDKPPAPPAAALREHAASVMLAIPFARALGFELVKVEPARAVARVGWREELIGDPETGVIAGGVITTLLDNVCGVAVIAALEAFKSTATLDLRIDYMRPAEKGRAVIGEAECYHVTRSVAFCRAWAYHDSREKVIATGAGAFALNDPGRWRGGAMEDAVRTAGGGE